MEIIVAIITGLGCAGILAYISERKKNKLEHLTKECEDWYEYIIRIMSDINKTNDKEEILKQLILLKARINGYGEMNLNKESKYKEKEEIFNDGHIWQLIKDYEINLYKGKRLDEWKDNLIKSLRLLHEYRLIGLKGEVNGRKTRRLGIILLIVGCVLIYLPLGVSDTPEDTKVGSDTVGEAEAGSDTAEQTEAGSDIAEQTEAGSDIAEQTKGKIEIELWFSTLCVTTIIGGLAIVIIQVFKSVIEDMKKSVSIKWYQIVSSVEILLPLVGAVAVFMYQMKEYLDSPYYVSTIAGLVIWGLGTMQIFLVGFKKVKIKVTYMRHCEKVVPLIKESGD